MSENQFRDRVCAMLRRSFPNNRIEAGANLLYKLIVDGNGNLQPEDYRNPRRGQLAFQTDILVSNQRVPLVVIETKSGGFSTHDVLTYSAKAVKHKEVYPYLRYGLLVGDSDSIDKKFFVHNIGFDFALAVESIDSGSAEVIELVGKHIRAAESLLGIDRMERVRKYTTTVELTG